MVASKISIGIFLRRLVFERPHKWIIYGTLTISIVPGLTFFFVSLFQCNPISLFWDTEQKGRCLSPNIVVALAITYSVFAVISDLSFVIFSIYLIWGLTMKVRARVALVLLISMGCMYAHPSLKCLASAQAYNEIQCKHCSDRAIPVLATP